MLTHSSTYSGGTVLSPMLSCSVHYDAFSNGIRNFILAVVVANSCSFLNVGHKLEPSGAFIVLLLLFPLMMLHMFFFCQV